MSSRFTPNDIHPSIFEAVHALTSSYMNDQLKDEKRVAAATKHSGVWFAEYWKGCLLWFACLAPIVLGAAGTPDAWGKFAKVAFLVVSICAWLALGVYGYEKNKKLLTWEELDTLRPGLLLTEHQSLYIDCLQAVEESKVLDATQKKNWRDALYNALDQAIVLENLAEEMKQSAGGKNHATEISEVNRLEALVAKSSDPLARQAYEESLQMAKERMGKWDSVASQAERTEAHIELTRQTFMKTRDTLRGMRLQQQQTVHVDLEPLRANLNRVQTEAYEIQRALEELTQI